MEDVPIEDRVVISPCGVICLGCDIYREESLEAAKVIVNVWEGWNYGDVAGSFGLTFQEVNQTIEILKKYIKIRPENGLCRGCYYRVAFPCSISQCVKSKGYLTCAECDEFDPGADHICPHRDEENAKIPDRPFASRSQALQLVTRRLCSTNIENLRRCQEIGYINFIAEMKEKVNNGWRTWQVISPENVFREFYFKHSGK